MRFQVFLNQPLITFPYKIFVSCTKSARRREKPYLPSKNHSDQGGAHHQKQGTLLAISISEEFQAPLLLLHQQVLYYYPVQHISPIQTQNPKSPQCLKYQIIDSVYYKSQWEQIENCTTKGSKELPSLHLSIFNSLEIDLHPTEQTNKLMLL